jgi:glycosyltransferase involved in cell wall biosynthesis
MARNLWFQKEAARRLKGFSGDQHTIFSYSYAAGEIFTEAKQRGWRTVLGQIDPGPVEARLVSELYKKAGQKYAYEEIPGEYWDLWRREIALADKIVVNSAWSREALIAEGVAAEKIAIIPLAYEGKRQASRSQLVATFIPERPLRLLFLGQVTFRKGIDLVFEAMLLLPDLPIELDVVGPIQVDIPESVRHDARIRIRGPVRRSQTEAFYKQADLFLFPTYSDGFGLTQLEAMAAGLPVIASRFCGDVVQDGINGRVLQAMEADELADIIRELAEDPGQLSRLQENSYVEKRFHLDAIGRQLEDLFT